MKYRRMIHRRFMAAAAMVVLAAVAGCGVGGPLGSSNSGHAASGSLKIGLLLEETGQFSWYGQEAAEGANLYLKQHPSAGKDKVSFVTYDTGSNPENAITGFRKLVQQDNVNAVVGLGLTNEAKVVAPLAESLKTPLYALSGSFTPPNNMTFAMPVQISDMQKEAFRHFAAAGVKSIGLLSTEDATGQIADALFAKLANTYHMKMVADEHMADSAVDVTPQLTDIRAKKPDLIVAWEVGKPLGVVFNSAHQLGITTPFLISYGNLAPGFLQRLASVQPPTVYVSATKDVYWKDLPASDPQAGVVRTFHQAYASQFHQETGLGSASGYDAVMLLEHAVETAHSASAASIVSALEKTQGLQGVFGVYNMSPTNHVGLTSADAELGQIKNAQVVLLAKQ